MVIDWRKQIDECVKNTEIMPIFHSNPIETTLQNVLIVKKLHEIGYSNLKIFNWFKLAGSTDIYCVDDIEMLLKVAKKRRWPKIHHFEIFITKKEIDYINGLKTTKENKSYLLGIVAFTKMMNIKKKKPTFNIRDRSYVYYIATGADNYYNGTQRYRWISIFMNSLLVSKKISISDTFTKIKVYTNRRGGTIKEIYNAIIKADWIEWEATDGYSIKTLETDVKRLCDLAFHDQTAVCSVCGKEYIVDGYTKTNMCSECYEHYRFENQKIVKKKYDEIRTDSHGEDHSNDHNTRESIAITKVKVCSCCGKEFVASGNCKRTLCVECQKQRSKELTKIRQKKFRDKSKIKMMVTP